MTRFFCSCFQKTAKLSDGIFACWHRKLTPKKRAKLGIVPAQKKKLLCTANLIYYATDDVYRKRSD